MKLLFFTTALLCYVHANSAEETRLLDLEPTDAQQVIESQDQTLKYAPKVDTNVPAVRFLGNEPHNVLEDIYLARQYHGQDGLGGYLYGYSVPDIAKNEKKKAGGDLKGAYQYINGQGQEIKVEYWDNGNGFHQIDNVPKILPKQIDDLPEVKAEKDRFLKRWQEEAERNQRPVQSPYNSEGQYASGPLSAQGQRERQQLFAQSNYPHTSGNQYQQGSASQYQPQGGQQFGGQYRPQGSQYQSGQYQPGGQQSAGQYKPASQQSAGQYQPGGQYQQQGAQHQSGQYQPQGSQQFGGQYQPQGSQQSGQYQPGPQQSGASAGYYPTGVQQSSTASYGQNQPSYGQTQPSYGQNSPSHGQVQPSFGQNQPFNQQNQIKSYSSPQNQIDYSGQGSESKDIYASRPQQGKQNGEEEEEETTGPPKGFFYSYDYPVGIIVQKQGALKDVYSANKANFETQLQQGKSNDGSSQQGYLVH